VNGGKVKEMGRRKVHPHVLVLTKRMQDNGHMGWELGEEEGLQDSLSSSDSEEMEEKGMERLSEEDQVELNKIPRWSFPYNPEIGQGE
jgi:hypothetical protein